MFFTLKKAIGGLLLPLPFLLFIAGIALLLLWFTRWQKTGKCLISVSWLALLLLSLQPVATKLIFPIEDQYATYNETQRVIKYIVVLGGGYTYNLNWAPSSNLIGNSLPRVTEGVRQYRQHPNSKLIFTGAKAISNPMSSAQVAANVAQSLGVPTQDIVILDTPRDTLDEAQAVKHIVSRTPFLLVTSANHLPRAMRIFKQKGLNPIAAPANQLAIQSALNPWERAIPSPYYLGQSERAWYETLGSLWLDIKSLFSQEKALENKDDEE